MKKSLYPSLLLSLVILFASSCVSTNEYNKVKDSLKNCEDNKRSLKEDIQELEVRANEASALSANYKNENKKLKSEIAELEEEKRKYKRLSERLEASNKEINKQLSAIKAGSSEQISHLLTDLEKNRLDLEAREKSLDEKNRRLQRLETMLAKKDMAVKELKRSVMDALTGYKDLGITVSEKNGQVYVSMDEKLLFRSGKYVVAPNGVKALGKISTVLGKNPEINIKVEGHTDDVPLRGTGSIKDNWDLSVMRATAVSKILLRNKSINPKQITAAGRSKYIPVEQSKTTSARQKNRRTEIILTPNLDELFKLLEN
jgi:chemotaxis protein MotB